MQKRLNGKNKYYTLYSALRDDILSGKLEKGTRLPSKRALAENLSVSVTTVQTAYEQLLAEGFIYSKERSGYFVSEASVDFYGKAERKSYSPEPAPPSYNIDLVKGSLPVELFPFSVWAKLMRQVLSDCGEHLLARVPCAGDRGLREGISAYLFRTRGINADPERIIIGAGAEYLYGVVAQLLGRGSLIAVENPGYGKISASYKLYGANCEYIPVLKDGIAIEEVEKSNADAVHISPSHQFPTGAVMPATNRAKLINWAIFGQKYIIEDDYDSEFRLSGKPLQCLYSLCPERTVYMNTFSKSLAPSMRMGYMVLPPELYEKYLKIYSHSASVVPLFEQKTLARMLDGGHFERHINRLKNYYKNIRAALLDRVKSFGVNCRVEDTGSGPHMVLYFPDAPNDESIRQIARENGINARCLSDYLLEPAEGYEKRVIVNYPALTPEKITSIKF